MVEGDFLSVSQYMFFSYRILMVLQLTCQLIHIMSHHLKTQTHTHTHTQTHAHTHSQKYIQTSTHKYVHSHTCMRTHTYTHMRTHPLFQPSIIKRQQHMVPRGKKCHKLIQLVYLAPGLVMATHPHFPITQESPV